MPHNHRKSPVLICYFLFDLSPKETRYFRSEKKNYKTELVTALTLINFNSTVIVFTKTFTAFHAAILFPRDSSEQNN